MASGKTHDWVTVALLPSVWLLAHWGFNLPFHQSLLVTIGAWIGGFYLSPDLDTPSRPFYRWGVLRWIWIPYQWAAKHRSPLSHGLLWASWLRLFYLTGMLALIYAGLRQLLAFWGLRSALPPLLSAQQFLSVHQADFLMLGVGLWIGALIHIALDALTSAGSPKKRRR
jgi:uncharacterized metal-binding protein